MLKKIQKLANKLKISKVLSKRIFKGVEHLHFFSIPDDSI